MPKWYVSRSWQVASIAMIAFLGGVLATLLGIFLTSMYVPVIRLVPETIHPTLTLQSSRIDGANVIKVFRVDDPEMHNVGLKSGSLSRCDVRAFGTHGQPTIQVTTLNKQLIRPFETLTVDIFFHVTFTPSTGESVHSWKIECYDNLDQYAFRLRIPSSSM